jgi:hypothetical protein
MRKLISIVVPCYNESEILKDFIEELNKEIEKIDEDFEIIFVDNGSDDNSVEIFCNSDLLKFFASIFINDVNSISSINSVTLKNNSIGSNNTAIGYYALLNHTLGSNNTAIGSEASQHGNSGSDNIAIGVKSLFCNGGSKNIGIGSSAGLTISSGTENTLLGYSADMVGGGFTKSTAIGAYATITASNQIKLGTATETVNVPGNTTLAGTLAVTGATTLATLYAQYPASSIPQSAIIGGVGSNNFTADVSMNTKLSIGGDVSMNTKLYVGGDASMNTKLSIGGEVSMNSRLYIRGPIQQW